MISVGNNELKRPVASTEVECPHCNKTHLIEYGKDAKTGETSKLLGFYKCGNKSYLCSLNGYFIGNNKGKQNV